MRTRTQAKPVSRKKKNQEHPVTAMNGGTKTFPAVNPVQQHKQGGVAQLYRTHDAHSVSDGLELNSHSIRKDTEFSRSYQDSKMTFSSESGNFTGAKTNVNDKTFSPIMTANLPNLKISETDQMAVVNDGAQQREFFATQQLFDESNQKLEAAAAKVRLGKEGGNLQLVDNGPQLFRTVPLSQPVPQGNWTKLESISTTYCNKVTDMLIGATARVGVLSKAIPLQQDREETEVPMKQKHNDPLWLREFLAQPDQDKPQYDQLGSAYENYFREDNVRLEHAVEDRGNMDDNLLSQESQKYGVNEFALPEPGEAYMTTSMGSPENRQHMQFGVPRAEYFGLLQELQALNPALDIAEQNMSEKAKSLIDSWSYHFATVVARDGADTMTLENYNRGVENENHIRDIFHKLFIGFGEFQEEVKQKLEGGQDVDGNIRYGVNHYHDLIRWMATELPVMRDDLGQNAKTALQEALYSVETGLNVSTQYQNKQLYFEMYGAGNQSLHTKFKGTGYNPNTLRVRESFTEDKKAQVAKSALLMPRITQHFKKYHWNTDVSQKFIVSFLYPQIYDYVMQKQHDLDNVTDKIQLEQWRTDCREYQFPVVLETMTNIVNNLVPFNTPIHPPTMDALVDAIDEVVELNKANTTFTLESTLRKNFRNLGLSTYDLKDKKANADFPQLSEFGSVLMPILRNLV